jgi:hypothetical protein
LVQLEFPWDDPPASVSPPQVPLVPHRARPSARESQSASRAVLCAMLEQQTGWRVLLTITDNTSTLMSFKYDRRFGALRVRLHHMFLSTSPEIARALAAWIRSPRSKKAAALLNQFIRENTHQVRRIPPRPVSAVTKGRYLDLQVVFDVLNREHFANRVTATITWGRTPTTNRRRSIRFGGFFPNESVIRIHPLLDQKYVPAYFVRYIVFHEMLHAEQGIDHSGAERRRIHTAEFNRRERAYPDHARVVAWQADPGHLKKLLRSRIPWWNFLRPIP